MHTGKICIFFGRHLELHKKYYNLAIANIFNRFLELLDVGLDTKIIFLSRLRGKIYNILNYEFMVSSVSLMAAILIIGLMGNFVPTDHVLTG